MSSALSATPVPARGTENVVAVGRPCRSVLMVGPSPRGQGGMATVVNSYQNGGLFERFAIRYVSTHIDGSLQEKAWIAAKSVSQVARLLVTSDAPLIHIHLASRASVWRKGVICAMARIARRPYFLHAHGSEFRKFYHEECGAIAKWLVRLILERSALILALSSQWNEEFRRIAPRSRVYTLPNAVPVREASFGLPPEAPVRVLFAGRIGARKGTFELLRAFARLAPKFPGVTLVCAGDGEVEKLRAEASALGIGDRVECPGWLSAEQMTGEMARATVFTLPSHNEGVPMAVLEAMSHGLPVLTTPVGGIPEVIENDRNGLMVTPGDVDQIEAGLTRLLQSSADRARLGAAARATIVERYSLSSTIERLAALYRSFGVPERRV
jgi:glycosyltransferase involved in cell wall biosynthesis